MEIGSVKFPKFTSININMMPFIMGDIASIPKAYWGYYPIIKKCMIDEQEIGKIGYLSITESIVKPGKSQRRSGLHTEKHPNNSWGGGTWGGKGGLFLVSNIPNSCAIWDNNIQNPGPGGNCEHIRSELGKSKNMRKNILYWMHDGVPHEALKNSTGQTYERQWMRVVTSNVSIWYAEHSTKNPLGIQIPKNVKIITKSKFN